MLFRFRKNNEKSREVAAAKKAADALTEKYSKELHEVTDATTEVGNRLKDNVRRNGFTIKIHMAAGGKTHHAN